jgi:hypothetical protein
MVFGHRALSFDVTEERSIDNRPLLWAVAETPVGSLFNTNNIPFRKTNDQLAHQGHLDRVDDRSWAGRVWE